MKELTIYSGVVLVIDDEEQNRLVLSDLLSSEGYLVQTAVDGESGLAAVANGPHVVLLDLHMPGMGGLEVCRRIKANPTTRLTPVVFVTDSTAREHRIEAIDAGADDFLTKPFDLDELRARVRSLMRLKQYTDDLESAESVILSLALTVEARDTYTEGHCERLASYATALGSQLHLREDDLAALYRGAYLHDVGKVGIPDAVLKKAGPLTPREISLMQQHTVIGERLCGNLRSLVAVRSIVRHHHERLDGSGYPDGLSGDAVPLLAQIVSTVDAFDAMTTTRPYRDALTLEHAFGQLELDADRGLRSREFVDAFVTLGRSGALARALRGSPFAGGAFRPPFRPCGRPPLKPRRPWGSS